MQVVFRRLFIRFLRFILYLGVVWLVLASLWFSLPSPVPDDEYPTRVLNSGKTLTRVFGIGDLLGPNTGVLAPGGYSSLDFVLHDDEQTGQRFLEVGGPDDPISRHIYHRVHHPSYNISLSFPTGDLNVSKRILLTAREGQIGGITPSYVAVADSVLLYWWVAHDMATLAIRTRTMPVEKKVEVWLDSSYWCYNCPGNVPPNFDGTPLLVIHLPENEEPIFQFPSPPKSSSPSHLYVVRVALLVLLAPISVFFIGIYIVSYGFISIGIRLVFGFISFLSMVVTTVIACAILCALTWWLFSGRPTIPFTEIGRAVSTVINEARNRPPVVEERGLIDLESGAGSRAEEPVLVDIEAPNVAENSRPAPALT